MKILTEKEQKEKKILDAELNAYKKQLDNLERIESNKYIPHHESLRVPNDKPQQS
jgi:hypothetical protein